MSIFFLSLMLLMTFMTLSTFHPVMMAILLMGLAFFSSLLLGKLFISWIFYLLMLIFLGGVMVVLLFMVSICANEKFFFSGSMKLYLSLFLLIGILVNFSPLINLVGFSSYQLTLSLYQSDMVFSFILFMLVLVLCMISVVSVSKLESGPLVKRL